MGGRVIPPQAQSGAERAAQRWHKEQHKKGYGKCWCCCSGCALTNPHYLRGKRAALADIFARIRSSTAAMRPPDGKRRQ